MAELHPRLVRRPLSTATSARVPRRPASNAALLRAAVLAALTTSATAQQFTELNKLVLPDEGDNTNAVAYGDLDGDGDSDLVIANMGPNWWGQGAQNRLLLNDGSGGFVDVTATNFPVDTDPTSSVVIGDVDGDGDLDIVFGNAGTYYWYGWWFYARNGAQNRLYINDGTGNFTDATAQLPQVEEWTWSVDLGDVDEDGDLDLIFGQGYSSYSFPDPQANRLLLNDGSGIFTDVTAAQLPVSALETSSVVFGDVDGDGDLDLVCGSMDNWLWNGNEQNELFLNDGTGTFTNVTDTRMPTDADDTRGAALADIDGDGDLDAVFGNNGQNRLYLNDGAGTFVDTTAVQMPMDTAGTLSVDVVDVNGDGAPDLAWGNSGSNGLYVNDGAGRFVDVTAAQMPPSALGTYGLAAFDVDGDSSPDLIVGNHGENRLYFNTNNGVFVDLPRRLPPTITDATALVVADVDGDGDLDLVAATTGQNRLLLNDGSGNYEDVTATQLPEREDLTRSIALGDLDGDGDLDMFVGNQATQYSNGFDRVYLNDGAGVFVDATATTLPYFHPHTNCAALGDVDGDGDLDLVLGMSGQGLQNRLYLNDGTGAFVDGTGGRMPGQTDVTTAIVLGDLDGDGDLDMIVGNQVVGGSNGFDRVYLNDGTGAFSDVTATHMAIFNGDTSSAALGDVDGDGDLDVVLGSTNSATNRLYLNDGAGTFQDATLAQLPNDNASTRSVHLVDVDGDGDLDVLCANPDQNALYVNDGAGNFTDATAARLSGGGAAAIALGNVDADDDVDFVEADAGGARIMFNLQSQLDAPVPLRPGLTYTLEAYSRFAPPSALEVAFPALSTVRISVPLAPWGVLGIDPLLPLPPITISQPDGVGSTSLLLPNSQSLVGTTLYAQALLARQSYQERLTNVTVDVVF